MALADLGMLAAAASTNRAKWSSRSAPIRVTGPATDIAATHSPAPSTTGAATDATPLADSSMLVGVAVRP